MKYTRKEGFSKVMHTVNGNIDYWFRTMEIWRTAGVQGRIGDYVIANLKKNPKATGRNIMHWMRKYENHLDLEQYFLRDKILLQEKRIIFDPYDPHSPDGRRMYVALEGDKAYFRYTYKDDKIFIENVFHKDNAKLIAEIFEIAKTYKKPIGWNKKVKKGLILI